MSKALHLYDIVRRPVITEKSHVMADENNQYVFEVEMRANKIQIKDAIERIFDVDVLKVSTLVMPAKRGQRGRVAYTRRAAWKKAIVTVAAGQEISLFNV
ncbi:50S ribosomal protein L23 [Aggregatilinea lenta]|uniref:50S ribosomal protein L23 n=1 Tax=Aggregatilinea lenta TaxID=913108 RepID=UPI000E5A8BBE|nr:50S ribosomal protein L23 [Aggregatilinea lenta]